MKVMSEAWYVVQANLFPYQGQSVKLRSYTKQDERMEMKRRRKASDREQCCS